MLTYPNPLRFTRPNLCVSKDGSTLIFNTGDSIYTLQSNAEPGIPIATPTPIRDTVQPTPTPMDWMIMDGFGGIHLSRAEVERPLLPYFAPMDIARDLEPDPLGRGWYMLDGFGGIHTSSPELPLPPDGFLYLLGFDFARNLEVVVQDGQYTFILFDRFGAVHKVGAHADEINVEAPWFGAPGIARDLEPTATRDGWLILDGFGAMYDSRTFTINLATNAFWMHQLFAKGMVVLPDGDRILIDAWGGLHPSSDYTYEKIRSFENTPYIPGFDIFWDIELIKESTNN